MIYKLISKIKEIDKIQANLSNPATSLTKENGQIRQVVGIDRSEKYTEKFNKLGLDRKSE